MDQIISFLMSLLPILSTILAALVPAQTTSVYSSCQIPTGSVHLIAHRGLSADAPENTLPAFRLAGETGFWGAECDTLTTADGVWVVMHDDSVDRMTNGGGNVSDLTSDEISALTVDAGRNIEQYPNTGVPTLSEYLDVCREYGMHAVIEIKSSVALDRLDSLADLLGAREEKDRFILVSMNLDICSRIKELMPETAVYLVTIGTAETVGAIPFALAHKLDGLDLSYLHSANAVRLVKAAGLKTMVWTVDSVRKAERYWRWGVRDMTTNALTPTPPEGNALQQWLWNLRDYLYQTLSAWAA